MLGAWEDLVNSLAVSLPAPGPPPNLLAMRTRWIGIAALAVLGVAIAVGVRQAARSRVTPGANPNPPEEAIAQALRQARADSAALAVSGTAGDKSRWVAEVKGFDIADLSPGRRDMFVRFANAQRCTCGCGYTLAGCRTYDPTCPVSGPRVEKLLDSVRAGRYSGAVRARPKPARRG